MEELDEPMLSDVSIFKKVVGENRFFFFFFHFGKAQCIGGQGWLANGRPPCQRRKISCLGADDLFLMGLLPFCERVLPATRVGVGTRLAPCRCVSTDGKVAGR